MFNRFEFILKNKLSGIWSSVYRCCINFTNFLFYLPFGGFNQFYFTCSEFGLIHDYDRIIELCCGAGELTAKLSTYQFSADVIGVDTDITELENAVENLKNLPAAFVKADASSLPFQSDIFTKCFVSLGMHHLSSEVRRRTIREIFRVLTQDGLLFIIDYNLPKSQIRRYLALALAKTDQSHEAYKMVINDSLFNETIEMGFTLVRKEEIGWGMIQLIEFKKHV